jgi:ribosome-interacting GTPase 1
MDEAEPGALERLRASAGVEVVPVSVIDDESLEALKQAIWRLTGLIRVYPRRNGHEEDEPFALPEGATVSDFAAAIHNDVAATCRGARLWGDSARFPGQEVGRTHTLRDGDIVEVVVAR